MTAGVMLAAFLGAAGPAGAHDLWWEREEAGYVLHYGHMPGAHEGERILEYEVGDVARVRGLPEEGAPMDIRELGRTSPVRVRGSWAALSAEMAPVNWTKTPYGTVRFPKDKAGMPVSSWESREATKRIDRWRPVLARPLGDAFEIVPARDPTALRAGEKLRVAVFLNGAPVAGAAVAYDGKPRGLTGEDGTVNIKLRHEGHQNIQASFEEPLDGIRADKRVHSAALTFEVKP